MTIVKSVVENNKKRKRLYSPTKRKILLLLLAGAALSLSRTGKNQIRIIKEVSKEWKKIDRHNLYRLLHEFRHDRLVDWREHKDGTITVTLSEAGQHTAKRFEVDELSIAPQYTWDGKWRVVIYDIPHKKRAARDALRLKLHQLGFREWQKSVFIHPYPCRDEIDFIMEFFDVRPYVRYAELSKPTNEAELKLMFKLK